MGKWMCSHCGAINPDGAFKCHNCPNTSGDERWVTTPPTPPTDNGASPMLEGEEDFSMEEISKASAYARPYLMEDCKNTPFDVAKYAYLSGLREGKRLGEGTKNEVFKWNEKQAELIRSLDAEILSLRQKLATAEGERDRMLEAMSGVQKFVWDNICSCEHGFTPASKCSNAVCDGRDEYEMACRLSAALAPTAPPAEAHRGEGKG